MCIKNDLNWDFWNARCLFHPYQLESNKIHLNNPLARRTINEGFSRISTNRAWHLRSVGSANCERFAIEQHFFSNLPVSGFSFEIFRLFLYFWILVKLLMIFFSHTPFLYSFRYFFSTSLSCVRSNLSPSLFHLRWMPECLHGRTLQLLREEESSARSSEQRTISRMIKE